MPGIWRVAEATVNKIQVLRHENVPLKTLYFYANCKKLDSAVA